MNTSSPGYALAPFTEWTAAPTPEQISPAPAPPSSAALVRQQLCIYFFTAWSHFLNALLPYYTVVCEHHSY